MEIIGNIFIGLVFIAIGVAMLKYNFQLVNSFGRNNWFEYKLGSGSTYLVFQFVAILVVLFGMLFAVGLHDNVLEFIFSPLLKIFRAGS